MNEVEQLRAENARLKAAIKQQKQRMEAAIEQIEMEYLDAIDEYLVELDRLRKELTIRSVTGVLSRNSSEAIQQAKEE